MALFQRGFQRLKTRVTSYVQSFAVLRTEAFFFQSKEPFTPTQALRQWTSLSLSLSLSLCLSLSQPPAEGQLNSLALVLLNGNCRHCCIWNGSTAITGDRTRLKLHTKVGSTTITPRAATTNTANTESSQHTIQSSQFLVTRLKMGSQTAGSLFVGQLLPSLVCVHVESFPSFCLEDRELQHLFLDDFSVLSNVLCAVLANDSG
uniref:Uncharacterized protein n=1 Tax=Molossus molossus TaxID=27622 RepID=A0A7J8JXR8_MOLMO|nr:hypothetical protein HJG59_007939 [Molossus molossus]